MHAVCGICPVLTCAARLLGRCLQMLLTPSEVGYSLMNTSAAVLAQVNLGWRPFR
jgi:hypothetical protein